MKERIFDYRKESLTLADVLSGLWNFFPRVEREIRRLVDCLPSDLSIIFVVKGEHAGEEKVRNNAQTPQIHFLSIGLL